MSLPNFTNGTASDLSLGDLPTGTVRDESLAERTFPARDPGPRTSGDADEAATRTPSSDDDRSAETVPGAAPPDSVDRVRDPPERAVDGESLRERVDRLERENEALRRQLRQTQRERQDVIDRYERLLKDLDRASESTGDEAASTSLSSASFDRLTDRIARRLDLRTRWR